MAGEGQARDYQIAARIERLPLSPWHTWMRSIVGTAMFFDAFDAVALAYVLPAIVPLWKLTPVDIGAILAIGYAGQIIGSLFFGWLGERIGRVPTAVITIAIFSVFSLGCCFADDYRTLFWMRFFQGIGLGGETPVMHAYISEFAQSKNRARFTLVFQLGFAFGILAAALVGALLVPTWGWRWMFIIGAVPAIFALALRWMIPESPRWLASRGRGEEADRVLSSIEATIERQTGKPLPPVPTDIPPPPRAETDVRELFRGIYLQRTLVVWALWFFTYFIGYGLTGWLPTIYRTQFGLSLEQALQFSFIAQLEIGRAHV